MDELQAKVALNDDEERLLSEDEAVVSCLLFIQLIQHAGDGIRIAGKISGSG